MVHDRDLYPGARSGLVFHDPQFRTLPLFQINWDLYSGSGLGLILRSHTFLNFALLAPSGLGVWQPHRDLCVAATLWNSVPSAPLGLVLRGHTLELCLVQRIPQRPLDIPTSSRRNLDTLTFTGRLWDSPTSNGHPSDNPTSTGRHNVPQTTRHLPDIFWTIRHPPDVARSFRHPISIPVPWGTGCWRGLHSFELT